MGKWDRLYIEKFQEQVHLIVDGQNLQISRQNAQLRLDLSRRVAEMLRDTERLVLAAPAPAAAAPAAAAPAAAAPAPAPAPAPAAAPARLPADRIENPFEEIKRATDRSASELKNTADITCAVCTEAVVTRDGVNPSDRPVYLRVKTSDSSADYDEYMGPYHINCLTEFEEKKQSSAPLRDPKARKPTALTPRGTHFRFFELPIPGVSAASASRANETTPLLSQ